MQTITRDQVRTLIAKSNGRFFTVMFTKRTDQKIRTMTCRTGVKKNLKGGEPAYNFAEKDLIPVYDTQAGLKPGDTGYRCIPVEGIHTISINGKDFRVS
jgi:hypothetical protein